MKLIFASHNAHKTQEVRQILGEDFEITGLAELGFEEEIEETGTAFEENAFIKASAIYKKYRLPVIADDSGLCVNALKGKPGIYSARYAGPKADAAENNTLLLKELESCKDRSAYFIAVICYINEQGNPSYFTGKTEGRIIDQLTGNSGFGYDPLFIPEGYNETFASLGHAAKNQISHRYRALEEFKRSFT